VNKRWVARYLAEFTDSIVPLILLAGLVLPASLPSARAQQPFRIAGAVDDEARVTLPDSRLALADAKDLGPLDAGQPFDRMVLILKRSPQQQQALAALLDSQQTRGSADYHRWLTPEEIGRQFGPPPEDLARIQGWLEQQGFQIGTVAKSGMWIEFSGSVGQVNAAFRTQMRRYQLNGETHIANATDISIPAALAALVEGVPLHDFFVRPTLAHAHAQDSPGVTASWNGAHAITPGDFGAIYDLAPLYKEGLDGTGQTIAIVAAADVALGDVEAFENIFGLPKNLPKIIENGADPGFDHYLGLGEEATIDAEWSTAAAPGATIDLVVTGPQATSDPAELSAAFIVDQNLAQIVAVSFGLCEQKLGKAQNALWNRVWEQAAAQGMSVFVASGDSGAAGCATPGPAYSNFGNVATVNGVASSPYVTAVGGTEFDEIVNGGNAGTFWNATNAANLASATGYIPEMVWNDSCPGGVWCPPEPYVSFFSGGGGGVSTIYPTPSWQTLSVTGLKTLKHYSLPGQPGVSPRGLPDVAIAASPDHDGYLFCWTVDPALPDCQLTGGALTQTTFQNEAGGTSFSAQVFAGIMAVVNQKVKSAGASRSTDATGDGRQGLVNYVLYPLAAAEDFSSCNASNETNPSQPAPPACTFHDITMGNNSVPGYPEVAGYYARPGYDLVTGLGSVDVANLAANLTSAIKDFKGTRTTLATDPPESSITLRHGQTVTFAVSVEKLSSDTTSNTPAGNIALIAQSGSLTNSMGVVDAVPLVGNGGDAATGDFSIGNLPGGRYNLVAQYPGDSTFAGSVSTAIAVNIAPEVSTTTIYSGVKTWPYGYLFGFRATVAGTTGEGTPSGLITFRDNGKLLAKVPLDNLGVAYFNFCPPPDVEQVFPNFSAIPCPSIGAHDYTADYSGDTSFTASPTPPTASQAITVQITKGAAPGGINLASPEDNFILNAPITVSAVLESGADAALPTGTVQFFREKTSLGPPIPLAGNPAVASLANVQFPQGTYEVSAVYSGDSHYQATNYAETLNWGVPLGWTAATTIATVNPGQTATYNLNLSASGFTGTAAITCVAGLDPFQPEPTIAGTQCSVSPSRANLTSGGKAVPVVVTVTTTTQSRLAPAPFPGLPFTLPPVLALVFWGARRKRWRRALGCLLAVVAISAMSSCGGSAATAPAPPPSNPAPAATSGYFSVWAAAPIKGTTETVYDGAKLTLNVNQ